MVNLLRKTFIKDYENINKHSVRDAHGKLASLVGIISNLILFSLKLVAGLLTGSVAIVGDSINNLSDCGSSIVSLLGFKLANMPADKEHPYGHERIEYIAGLIVSIIILVVGFQLLLNSIDSLYNNMTTTLSILALVILGISIIIKLWQAYFNHKIGKIINSVTLLATAQDSLNDVISTTVILIGSLVLYFIPNIPFSLDGLLGLFVAIFILISGIKMIKETVDPLIGIIPQKEFIENILSDIKKYDIVLGIHDIRCHMYGPTKSFMTLHVEVDASADILYTHDIIDNIEKEISAKYNLELTIHMDPIETKDEYTLNLKSEVKKILTDLGLNFHDFRVVKGHTHTNVLFDIIIPRNFKLTSSEIQELLDEHFSDHEPKLYFVITFDGDYLG